MGGHCRLRPASLADLDRLASLEEAAFTDPWSVAELRAALGWSESAALVAERGGELVGYVLGRVIVDEAEILSIAVVPACRRMGIGRQMLEAMLARLVERGARMAWLEVRMSNAAARAMYAEAGFVAAGVRRGYYRLPLEDAVILRRQLSHGALPRPAMR